MRAEEALEDLLVQLGRDARPVVLDGEHDLAVAALDRWPRPRCRDRCGAARSPSGSARAGAARRGRRRPPTPGGAEIEISWSPATGSSSAAASVTTSDRSTGRCGGSRPASARASSSRSATRRRMRREERSAEAAASRCSPGQRLLEQLEVGQHRGQRRAQLVRGVGDELALARQRGLGLRARLVERVQHRLERARPARRPRRRPRGAGCVSDGSRVRSISRAAAVSSAIGSIARRAVARPASSASAAPPSTPRPRNSFTRLAVALTSEIRRAYWTRTAVGPEPGIRRTSRVSTRQPSISAVLRIGRPEVGRARACCQPTESSSVITRIAAFCRRREVVEVERAA